MESILIALIVVGCVAWIWNASRTAQERAIRSVLLLLRGTQIQLLDQTVSLSQLKLERDKHGRVRWVRTYTFDVSPDGVNRAQGSLTFTADRVEVIELPEGFDSASSKRPR